LYEIIIGVIVIGCFLHAGGIGVGKIKCALCLLLFIQIQSAFSFDEEWDKSQITGFGDTLKQGTFASGQTLFSNGVLMLINKICGFHWGSPTLEYIKGNFTTPWEWESTDGFTVNQLGHPYQGSTYFNAGRVNGFGFYGSTFFNALGSFTWEALCESQLASANDFITTVTGSMALGEMLYRLHLEAYAAGAPLPLTFLISPTGGIHILIKKGKATDPGKNLYQLQSYWGGGYTKTTYSLKDDQQDLFSYNGTFGDIGLKLIYGDPFEQDTIIPYRHFELSAAFGMKFGHYQDYRVISDGYLFSFSPICNDTNAMSTGLTMHFDFVSLGKSDIYISTIDMYSHALDWTIKYQHLFSEATAMELKWHTGFTFWGVSNYYSPDGVFSPYDNRIVTDLKNYGYGVNSKLFFNLENKKLGKLETSLFFYSLWPYPKTSDLSTGTVFWVFTDITYSHLITKRFSMGISGSSAIEWGTFSEYPDTKKRNDRIKFFTAWNL